MKISVGSDERTPLTDDIVAALKKRGHEVSLHGPLAGGDQEWAEVGETLGREVASGQTEHGVLFCWTGTGASIAANKVTGVRAALCGDAETARGARRWNRANVLVMSLRATSPPVGIEILDAYLEEPPEADDFDRRNLARITALENAED